MTTVCSRVADDESIWYAELERAPSWRCRSWRSWHTRWWWEIMQLKPDDMPTTWAYENGGSGGTWTREGALTQCWLAIGVLMAETPK